MSDFVINNGILEKYTGSEKEVIIPEQVTEIRYWAFHECTSVERVIISSNVTNIGHGAFLRCHNLKQIEIAPNVTKIEMKAFYGCSSLEEIKIPFGVSEIEDELFCCCSSLKKVEIPSSVTKIGKEAFYGCSALENIEIPSSVTIIGKQAFYNCNHLKKIDISSSVTSIGVDAFYGCSSLQDENGFVIVANTLYQYYGNDKNVEIPEYVTKIDTHAFRDCKSLERVKIPSGIEELGSFYGCTNLKHIDFPEKVASAGIGSFDYCKNLKEIEIPFGVIYIGEDAFYDCISLKKIKIPESVTLIARNAFAGCMALEEIVLPKEAKISKGHWFGYDYPVGLLWQLEELLPFMDSDAVYSCIISTNYWEKLSWMARARIFLTMQDKKMKKSYQKLIQPENCELLAQELLQLLVEKVEKRSKKECETVAQFLLDYFSYMSGDCLKKIYEAISSQKAGASSVKLIDANVALKKKIESADVVEKNEAEETQTNEKYDVLCQNMQFDEDGLKRYDLGNTVVYAVLQSDLSLVIEDSKTGKISKTIPKRGADAKLYEIAKADFQSIQKSMKRLLQPCKNELYRIYLDAQEQEIQVWKEAWLGNFIVRTLAQLVVWQQGETFFSVKGKDTILANGEFYALTNEAIRVAHPMDMSKEQLSAWQSYFIEKQYKQPFSQLWEPCYEREEILSDRYRDCSIRTVYLLKRKVMGIYTQWYDQVFYDGEILDHRHLEMDGFKIQAYGTEEKLEITCIEPKEWNRRTNAIVAFLDRITVYDRIKKDDVSIGFSLCQFTQEKISELIQVAVENNATNVTALLLEYQNNNFVNFSPFDEFELDL